MVVLNPFNTLNLGSSGFNPLASLDPTSDTFVDDVAALGEALIKIEGTDPHWPESAQELVVALLMWEVKLAIKEKRPPLLENVRRMLTEPEKTEKIATGEKIPVMGLRRIAATMLNMGGYEISSLIGRFMEQTDEISSIKSTADIGLI